MRMTENAPFDPSAHGWTPRDRDGFPGLVGPFWSRRAGDAWRWGFVAEDRHMNGQGVVHGGMMMTFIDQVLGIAVHLAIAPQRAVTIELSSQFIGAARAGEFLEAETVLTRKTRSLVFMQGRIMCGEKLLLSAQGIWKILGA